MQWMFYILCRAVGGIPIQSCLERPCSQAYLYAHFVAVRHMRYSNRAYLFRRTFLW